MLEVGILFLAAIVIALELAAIIYVVNIVIMITMFFADITVDWAIDNFKTLLLVCFAVLLL